MYSVKKNFLYNAAYQILIMLIPLVTIPYISRVLGVEGVGVYSYAYSVAYYFVMFILLGLNNYGNRTIAASKDNRYELSRNFSNIYITQLILGIFIVFLYFGYCLFISDSRITSLILGIYVISGVFDVNWFFYGMEQFKLTVVRNSIVKLSSIIAIFIFVKSAKDVYIYCFIVSMSFFLSQLLLWPFLVKLVDYVKPTLAEVKKHIKPNLMLFITVLAVSLFKVMDKIMLGIMSDYSQVGFYESSEKIINIPIAFVTALGTVMLPRMTNMVANQQKGSAKVLRLSILFAMFLTSSMCFGIMGVADIFVPIFYGDGYDLCISLFMIILPSCIFLAFANVIRTQFLLPHKMDSVYIISAFIGAGVNLILNILLIPHFAALGAAVGTLVAEVTVCFYQCFKCRKEIPIGRYALQSFPLILSGAVMFAFLRFIRVPYVNDLVVLIVKVFLGAGIYFISLGLIIFVLRDQYKDLIVEVSKIYKHRK